jgi:hypothetical protein
VAGVGRRKQGQTAGKTADGWLILPPGLTGPGLMASLTAPGRPLARRQGGRQPDLLTGQHECPTPGGRGR